MVLLLLRSLYGLKQSPRRWWKELQSLLISLGFIPSACNDCLLFMRIDNLTFVMLLYYVDDVIIACIRRDVMLSIYDSVKEKFRVSSDNILDNFLGIKIMQERVGAPFELSMSDYVQKMMDRYKLSPRQSVLTPMVENFQAQFENALLADAEDFCCQEKIGTLLFLMICISLDIAFAVWLLTRFCNKVSKVACFGVTRVLQYCYNTMHRTLCLRGKSLYISVFTDSDWAGCRLSRCSTGGHIVFVGDDAVAWGSMLQKMHAQSVAEAEYIVMNDPLKTVQWIRWLFKDSGIEQFIT